MSPELESEQLLSRTEIASFFREFADGLDGEKPITISIGGQKVRMDPPEKLEFDIEVEDESKRFRRGERSLEIELEWRMQSGDRPIQG